MLTFSEHELSPSSRTNSNRRHAAQVQTNASTRSSAVRAFADRWFHQSVVVSCVGATPRLVPGLYHHYHRKRCAGSGQCGASAQHATVAAAPCSEGGQPSGVLRSGPSSKAASLHRQVLHQSAGDHFSCANIARLVGESEQAPGQGTQGVSTGHRAPVAPAQRSRVRHAAD